MYHIIIRSMPMVRRVFPPLIALALLTGACADQNAVLDPGAAAENRDPAPQPGRYIVGFDGEASISPDVLAASGGQIVDAVPQFNALIVDGVTNPEALRAANPAYIESGFNMYAEPIKQPLGAPAGGALAVPGATTAPWVQSGILWGMKAMKATEGYAMTNGGAGINVCIVDSGVDILHQELAPRTTERSNWVTTDLRIDDPNGHGSHVAGTAAGHGVVAPGVAPRANIMSARVLNTAGSGAEVWIVNGMNWCVDNGAHVINMSLGGTRYLGQPAYISSPIFYGTAVNYATSNGVVVVTASGNSNTQLPNPNQMFVPAQVPGTIIVGATGPLSRNPVVLFPFDPFDPNNVWRSPDNKAYYSNFGEAIHVFAPGGRGGIPLSEPFRRVNGVTQGATNDFTWSVCSGQTTQTGAGNVGGNWGATGSCSNNTGRYVPYGGTSMAAPHVAGMAALLYAELGGVRNAANRARVENCIKNTTDNIGPSSTYGGGRANVQAAINAIRANQC
jgi:lantibiotic leader peptide-processing serine protease